MMNGYSIGIPSRASDAGEDIPVVVVEDDDADVAYDLYAEDGEDEQ
jgi:hypothetical protein